MQVWGWARIELTTTGSVILNTDSAMVPSTYHDDQQAGKAQVSLCICADLPEPSLLAYPKYACR